MQLKAEPEMAGKVVRCPGCNSKLSIPANLGGLPPPSGLPSPTGVSAPEGGDYSGDGASYQAPEGAGEEQQQTYYEQHQRARGGWEESDPTNPSLFGSLSIGVIATLAWYGILFPFGVGAYNSPAVNTMDYIHDLFYERTWVNYTETFFFFWAVGILWLKMKKLRHQKDAMFLDILPTDISQEVNSQNVSQFIDHLYGLPSRLRDSMMVNRIRKGLELFEVRQNNGEVSGMLDAQSNIDGARIGGSYSLVKVFLWAIPILGFIGTVLGLSQAIGSMDLTNVSDMDKIMASIGNVTSGLGTAFDTTLLGLVLAMFLNFPMNALSKAEDDNLNNIDAFCNEVLMPRLNDGGGLAGGDTNGMMDVLVKAVANAQKEFLVDLNSLSAKIKEQADNLDKRATAHQERVDAEFAATLNRMREEFSNAVKDSVKTTTDYTRALATGIQGLNNVLTELGSKQVIVQQVQKKGWFSRQ
ncbi:MotA/TolQ/ExbB proton channel family protein [Prosthecobacter debontii]|uniref:MotA/TolQ/ExbB proton channel family protein n=1 Tax=Prosthecobacter debontii TaxID=48467 RepID=A0A1T4YRC8_9BACT|nr:MotA/TolQ/ExbB proton channel family protein [Prosthecobacter debontii]SKB04319.1 MotA/TolQ/ExbB proton channel family protein [Prosthecobacter debontii]